jgi:hypothetical protein
MGNVYKKRKGRRSDPFIARSALSQIATQDSLLSSGIIGFLWLRVKRFPPKNEILGCCMAGRSLLSPETACLVSIEEGHVAHRLRLPLGVHDDPVPAVERDRGVPLAGMLAAEKAELSREIPSRLLLVVSHEMLALLPFPVVLRDYTLVTPGP